MTEFIGFAYASLVAAGGVIGYVRAGILVDRIKVLGDNVDFMSRCLN